MDFGPFRETYFFSTFFWNFGIRNSDTFWNPGGREELSLTSVRKTRPPSQWKTCTGSTLGAAEDMSYTCILPHSIFLTNAKNRGNCSWRFGTQNRELEISIGGSRRKF